MGRTPHKKLMETDNDEDYCDYLYVMSRGAVVAEGTPETILEPDLIRTVFGVESVLVDVPELKRKTIVFVC